MDTNLSSTETARENEKTETNFDRLLAALEPAATAGENDWANVALVSMAVSLKRIADMLDGTTMGICCTQTIFNPNTRNN